MTLTTFAFTIIIIVFLFLMFTIWFHAWLKKRAPPCVDFSSIYDRLRHDVMAPEIPITASNETVCGGVVLFPLHKRSADLICPAGAVPVPLDFESKTPYNPTACSDETKLECSRCFVGRDIVKNGMYSQAVDRFNDVIQMKDVLGPTAARRKGIDHTSGGQIFDGVLVKKSICHLFDKPAHK